MNVTKNKVALLVVVALSTFISNQAFAGTATGSVNLTATLTAVCSVSTTGMTGSLGSTVLAVPMTNQTAIALGSLSVTCNQSHLIGFNAGTNKAVTGAGAIANSRHLKGSIGAISVGQILAYIPYDLKISGVSVGDSNIGTTYGIGYVPTATWAPAKAGTASATPTSYPVTADLLLSNVTINHPATEYTDSVQAVVAW